MSEDTALQQLRAILARPEFQTHTSRPFWDQLLAPIGETLHSLALQVGRLFIDTLSGREGMLGTGALVAAAAVLVLGGLYLVRAVLLAVTAETTVRATSLVHRRERSDELWQESERLAQAGRLEDAARAAYLSALYALDEHAVLRVEHALTNREHARRLARDHPHLGGLFLNLVEEYDRLRYGRQTINEPTFDRLRRLVSDARASALSSGAA